MRRVSFLALLLAALLCTATAAARKPVRQVQISSLRVTLPDVVPGLGSQFADVDLGPAPAPGGSRLVTRAAMKKALKRQQVHGITKLPSAVRVVRKMRKLDKAALTKITKKAIAKHGLPRGVSLSVVRARGGVSVAAGWSDVKISVPKNPRRTGTWSTTAMLSFTLGKHRLARVAVPVTMKLSAAAAKPDISRGDAVQVAVVRGLVRVSVRAFAKKDADIGDIFPAQLRPSGRVLRAKLIAVGKAVVVETGR